jgi:hypothetical protein
VSGRAGREKGEGRREKGEGGKKEENKKIFRKISI